jgi:4-hydroxy-4-methyl-2-oxoglutarate aldolase
MNELSQTRKEQIRRRYLNVDASNAADVLDKLGYAHQGLSAAFMRMTSNDGPLAGWAYTIQGQMAPFSMEGDPDKMKACQGVSPGDVTVWSGSGEGICYFGELIAIGMRERGGVGAIVDGGIRDVRWISKMDFPVFAKYRTPIQSIGRWKVNGWQQPVSVQGATIDFVNVAPGDFILADEDGALCIPAALVERVLEEAEHLTAAEVRIRTDLKAGLSLAEALKKYGHV